MMGIVRGLIDRLKEKREDFASGAAITPKSYLDDLKLHPRIADVSRDLFLDGYTGKLFLQPPRHSSTT